MSNRMRRGAIRTLTALAVLGAAGVIAVGHAGATAEPGWTAPSMPVACTPEQSAAGDVASCLLTSAGLPETRGWPTPPFPTPVGTTPAPWVDLKIGSAGPTVTAVQQALTAAGFPVDADGLFGALTGVAVTSFQTANTLPATGVVDSATADALGVSNTVSIFPPPGWTWLGWGYNSSPALAAWESQLVSNAAAIGGGKVPASSIRSLPDSYPLFEGFLRDVVAGGYTITDVGTYVFRCTSNSRKTCNGQSRRQLSNHSYGLAVDLNVGANPERTYLGVGGASACATPVSTDVPTWMVRAAERWGLYWGGYGWNGGCATPAQVKGSVLRDPMHFEFRGTLAQARAISAFNTDGRCVPVIDDAASVVAPCLAAGATPGAGTRVVVDPRAPDGATAALVNLTVAGARSPGFVTAEGCGPAAGGLRSSSNSNATAGQVVANLAVVPLDASGRFCLYRSAAMHTIVDVQGFFAPATSSVAGGNLFTPVAAVRVMDTRSQGFCSPSGVCTERGPNPAGSPLAVTAAPIPAVAVATLANLTVTEPTAAGYLTADSCPSLRPGPQTRSNSDFVAGATVANLAVVPSVATAGGAQFCTYASARAQTLVDVQGFFAPPSPAGWGYTSLPPQRLLDTRECWTDPATAEQRCGQLNPAGSIVHVKAPDGASAVLVNITLTEPKSAGYATADRCSALIAGPQTKSNGNVGKGATAANLAVVPVDPDGTFCVFVNAPMHIVVDLQGTFSPTGALRFTPISPVRRQDTRGL